MLLSHFLDYLCLRFTLELNGQNMHKIFYNPFLANAALTSIVPNWYKNFLYIEIHVFVQISDTIILFLLACNIIFVHFRAMLGILTSLNILTRKFCWSSQCIKSTITIDHQ